MQDKAGEKMAHRAALSVGLYLGLVAEKQYSYLLRSTILLALHFQLSREGREKGAGKQKTGTTVSLLFGHISPVWRKEDNRRQTEFSCNMREGLYTTVPSMPDQPRLDC